MKRESHSVLMSFLNYWSWALTAVKELQLFLSSKGQRSSIQCFENFLWKIWLWLDRVQTPWPPLLTPSNHTILNGTVGLRRRTGSRSLCCLCQNSSAVSSAMTFSSQDFTCFSILWNCISVEVILWFSQKAAAITYWSRLNGSRSTISLFIETNKRGKEKNLFGVFVQCIHPFIQSM